MVHRALLAGGPAIAEHDSLLALVLRDLAGAMAGAAAGASLGVLNGILQVGGV
jgi:hypothetical protein